MKHRTVSNSLVVLGLALFSVLPAYCEGGYKLEQHSDFWGQQVVYVSQQQLYITAPKLNLRFFMRAPDWTVTGINDATKTFTVMSYHMWSHDVLTHKKRPKMPHVRLNQDTVAGVPAQRYLVDNPCRPGVRVPVPEQSRNGVTYNTSFWVAPSIKVPPQLTEILTVSIEAPNGLGLPLRALQYAGDGKCLTTFDTLVCEKVEMPKELFQVPKGYHQVANETELIFASSLADDAAGQEKTTPAESQPASAGERGPKGPAFEGWVPGDESGTESTAAGLKMQPARGFWVPGD